MTEGTRQSTRLNSKWVFKMTLFLLLLLGLGVWAAADAFWIYPARGRNHVDFALRAYLECLRNEGRLMAAASVEDPAAELARLDASNSAESRSCDSFKYAWLLSLSRIERMSALTQRNRQAISEAGGSVGVTTLTMFADPQDTLDSLSKRLGTANAPKPLAAYDIPLQYVFMAVGFGGAAWMVLFLMRCRRTVFQYDPAEHRLFMPGGKSFVPAEIKDVDKRDWHKYYIYLTLNDGSKEMKFDLLRYSPLEEWILEMEKLHPNYEPPPPEDAEEEPSASAEEQPQTSEQSQA